MPWVLALLLYWSSPLLAQVVTPPEMLGVIAGPGSVVEPPGVRFYGTDLGRTFEHRGQHFMLFGDTWASGTGILYAPNIIDAYTRSDGAGGLDVFWNVSVWNPYLVALLKTNVKPSAPGAATACPSATAAHAGGRLARFRWCARSRRR